MNISETMPCSATVAEIVANSKPDAKTPDDYDIRKAILSLYEKNYRHYNALELFIENGSPHDYQEVFEAIAQALDRDDDESYARIGRAIVEPIIKGLQLQAVEMATEKVNEEENED